MSAVRRRPGAAAALPLGLALAAFAQPAAAAGRPFSIEVAPCVPVRPDEILRLVARERLQIGGAGEGGAAPGEGSSAPSTVVRATCAGPTIVLRASTPGGAAVERRLDRALLAEGGAERLLVVLAAELAAASVRRPAPVAVGPPPSMQAAAAAPSVQAAPPPSVQAAAPSPGASRPPDGRPGAALALAGVARLFPTTDSALYGAALEADIPLPLPRAPGVSWGGDLAGGLASSERPLGRARAIDLSASIRMAARRAFGPLALDGGVGWRLAWTRLSGTSTQRGAVVRTGAHLWTGPLAHGGAQLRVAGRLVLGARLELGHVLRPVKARIGTTTALGMGGPWIALGIGAGVNFR